MTVSQAEDGTAVEPNHVYVIPPDADISIRHGRLTLVPRAPDGRRSHLSVDHFLRSLAAERGSHAIGVVLSGNASDGTDGLRAIKAESGITFAQDPASAKFDGMPRSAVTAGVVDYALAIPELARELVRLSRHPYVAAADIAAGARRRRRLQADPDGRAQRLRRRLHRIQAVDAGAPAGPQDGAAARGQSAGLPGAAAARAGRGPRAVRRHPDSRHVVLPRPGGLRDAASADPPRHPEGQAGGSAHSRLGGRVRHRRRGVLDRDRAARGPGRFARHPVQIFGSDLSEPVIAKARAGLYPDAALRDVSEERRRRYFVKTDRGYRINKTVRDLCVFVQHDLARDPPFSKLDLVSCRNVLIYFDQALQKRIVPSFHYALNQPGYLLLGHSESISGFSQLFSVVDKASKIFARTALASTLRFAPRADTRRVERPAAEHGTRVQVSGKVDVAKHLDRLLLARYAPPGVLINEKLEILQFRGQTGAYLQPAPGDPQNDVIKMARPGLIAALRATIAQAKKDKAPVRRDGVEVDQDGVTRRCNLVVLPFTGYPEILEPLYIVLFEDAAARRRRKARRAATPTSPPLEEDRRIPQARARARRHQGVSAVADRGARADQRRSRLGQRGARVGQRRAAEHERGAGDREGRAAVDQRRADHRQRRAAQPQPRGHAEQQRPAEPARHRRLSHRHPRSRTPHPPFHAPGPQHPERRRRRHRPCARRHQAQRRRPRSRSRRSPTSSTRW